MNAGGSTAQRLGTTARADVVREKVGSVDWARRVDCRHDRRNPSFGD